MSFERFKFDRRIAAGIDAVGYTTPTPIQEQAIPVVLAGRDVLGIAQTGTGKTAVFILPILQRLLKGKAHRVRALILAPTRELAEQINRSTKKRYRSGGRPGSGASPSTEGSARAPSSRRVSKGPQLAALRRGAEIVVACPGRLLDHMGARAIDLSGVEVLVLDEADRMCDMGFLPDIRRIINKLPRKRQTLFFSPRRSDPERSGDGADRDDRSGGDGLPRHLSGPGRPQEEPPHLDAEADGDRPRSDLHPDQIPGPQPRPASEEAGAPRRRPSGGHDAEPEAECDQRLQERPLRRPCRHRHRGARDRRVRDIARDQLRHARLGRRLHPSDRPDRPRRAYWGGVHAGHVRGCSRRCSGRGSSGGGWTDSSTGSSIPSGSSRR